MYPLQRSRLWYDVRRLEHVFHLRVNWLVYPSFCSHYILHDCHSNNNQQDDTCDWTVIESKEHNTYKFNAGTYYVGICYRGVPYHSEYILCNFPWRWIVGANGVWFCNTSVVVSYLVNIWVYIAMSKQFRDSLFQLFSCCKHKQQESESIGSNIITISTSVM